MLFSRTSVYIFLVFEFVRLFDARGQSHQTVYALRRFMLGITVSMTVSRSCKVKRVFAKSPAQEIAAHEQFTQKENGHSYAS